MPPVISRCAYLPETIGAMSFLVMATSKLLFALLIADRRRRSVPFGTMRGLSGDFPAAPTNVSAASAQTPIAKPSVTLEERVFRSHRISLLHLNRRAELVRRARDNNQIAAVRLYVILHDLSDRADRIDDGRP